MNSEPLSAIELQRMETVIDRAEIKRTQSVEFLTSEMRRLVDEIQMYRNGGDYESGYEAGHDEGFKEGKREGRDEAGEDDDDAPAPRPLALGRA